MMTSPSEPTPTDQTQPAQVGEQRQAAAVVLLELEAQADDRRLRRRLDGEQEAELDFYLEFFAGVL